MTKKELTQLAKGYVDRGEQYSLFEDELGWCEWMKEYCCDESSLVDNGKITDADIQRINAVLRDAWNDAIAEEQE